MRSSAPSGAKEQPGFGWQAMAHVNAAILFIDRDLNLTVGNEQCRDLLPTRAEVGARLPLRDCVPEDSEEFVVLSQVIAEARELRDRVMRWEVDGRVRHVLVDAFAERDPKTGRDGLFFLMKDIGNFSAIEQHVQRSERLSAIGKMAAGIAHEIRNPLTTVKGFLQVLDQRFATAGMQTEQAYAGFMMAELQRLEALVEQLLLLSSPTRAVHGVCSVSAIVAAVRAAIAAKAELRGVTVRDACAADLYAEGDAQLLELAVSNLAMNGIEASESGGVLSISATRNREFVQIDIGDTGPGIPYYLVDKVFDVFFTTKDKAIGLGLPIVDKVVEAHGGELRVSTKGFGTTVSMLLPAAPPPRSSAKPRNSATP